MESYCTEVLRDMTTAVTISITYGHPRSDCNTLAGLCSQGKKQLIGLDNYYLLECRAYSLLAVIDKYTVLMLLEVIISYH